MSSWWQLEQQSETPADTDDATTRARREMIARDTVTLPPLPTATVSRPWLARLAFPIGSLALAASVAVVVWQPRETAIKGGDSAISLVRERDGSIAYDGDSFADGDRFKVRLTCAPGSDRYYDVAVHQAGQTVFPLSSGHTTCGNEQPLPGALSLTGREAAQICVRTGAATPPRTSAPTGVCATLIPAK